MDIAVIEEGKEWKVESKSAKGKFYMVEFNENNELVCSCPSKVKCKHIKEIEKGLPGNGKTAELNYEDKNGFTVINGMELPNRYIHVYKFEEKINGVKTGNWISTPHITLDGLKYLINEYRPYEKLDTVMLTEPTDTNGYLCIFKCKITFKDSTSVSGHGDAVPDKKSVGYYFIPHYIRFAETRSIARAMRHSLLIDMVCTDEFDDGVPAGGKAMGKGVKDKLTEEQYDKLVQFYAKHTNQFDQREKIIVNEWTINLMPDEADFVIERTKSIDTFDYNEFKTLRNDVANFSQQ